MENQNKKTVGTQDTVRAAANQDQNELAIFNAKYDRKIFMESLKNGTLPCLPGKDGFANTEPARNPISGTTYHGISAILLKDRQLKNNYPTAEYVTLPALDKINEKLNLGFKDKIHVKKGEKGFFINFKDNKTNTVKSFCLFNVAQISDPQKIRDYVTVEKYERRENVKKSMAEAGKEFVPYSEAAKKEPAVIKCSSSEPEAYLGQYLAAISSGARFKVSQDQAESFKKNTEQFIFQQSQKGAINPFNLNILSAQANKYCKTFLSEQSRTVTAEKDILQEKPAKKTPRRFVSKEPEMEMAF